MKIVYVAMEYDYGFRERGKSFEESAFHDTLVAMGHEIVRFDFMENVKIHGRTAMNQTLKALVFDVKPELVFCVLFKDEIDKDVMASITRESGAVTINWFCDDHWRFENFSRHYAHSFTWVTTTDKDSVSKYRSIGYENALLTQWACNHFVFKKMDLALKYDVTFVGQPHGNRRKIITKLKERGIDVQTWGFGWENGRVDLDQMIAIFNRSKINLNLSNSSTPRFRFWEKRRDQIKGRNFEIPGCGAFQLASYVEGIEDYFVRDKEIVCFKSDDEMLEQIEYYLNHQAERSAIASAGYLRAMREHTYEQRFVKIFHTIFEGKHV